VPRPFRPRLTALEGREVPATFAVTTTADSGPGSLFDAILAADTNNNPNQVDQIVFAIPGLGVQTIHTTGLLPLVEPVKIDGYTQGNGAKPNTLIDGSNAVLRVELDGSSAAADTVGLLVQAPNCEITGLVINRFKTDGVRVESTGAKITGNFIGTDATGSADLGNGGAGVRLTGAGNTVGGLAYSDRNVISGNAGAGVLVTGVGAVNNVVRRNLVGTDLSGALDRGNTGYGVQLTGGGGAAVRDNVISGNDAGGVEAIGASVVATLAGNRIGTDAAGAKAVPNAGHGVTVAQCPTATVGGSLPGDMNLISGNAKDGVLVAGLAANGVVVQGNRIGTDLAGGKAVPNGADGVEVNGAFNAVIGGAAAGQGNLISGNHDNGVEVSNGGSAVIRGNRIGTDVSGTAAVGNDSIGVYLRSANSVVGGPAAGAGNVIAGGQIGVNVQGPTASQNTVQGNLIGTNAAGTALLPSAVAGVGLGGPSNLVGGAGAGEGNVIAGAASGVVVGISGNVVRGNFIGTDRTGTLALGNGYGVRFDSAATGNTLGGIAAGQGNVIARNTQAGVLLAGTGELVSGNTIFANGVGIAPAGMPNDPKDADAGPNNGQNYPVVTSAVTAGGQTNIACTLNSTPNEDFRVELFATPANAAGDYEGLTYLGQVTVTTDANGDAAFVLVPGFALQPGTRVTATAINVGQGDTSAFSPAVAVPGGTVAGAVFDDANGNGAADPGEVGRSGVTVFLDANANGILDPNEPTATTDAAGAYTLTTAANGTFAVVTVPPVGTHRTTTPATVTVTDGVTSAGPSIGLQADPPPLPPPPPPPVGGGGQSGDGQPGGGGDGGGDAVRRRPARGRRHALGRRGRRERAARRRGRGRFVRRRAAGRREGDGGRVRRRGRGRGRRGGRLQPGRDGPVYGGTVPGVRRRGAGGRRRLQRGRGAGPGRRHRPGHPGPGAGARRPGRPPPSCSPSTRSARSATACSSPPGT
jgi:hypothetical protein